MIEQQDTENNAAESVFPDAGNADAPTALSFEEMYEKYAQDVLRVSYFYLGDRQKAEDVCQDVFVRLLTNTPVIQEGREKAWLLKVALNRCRDLWRAAWAKRVVLGSPAFELYPAPDDIKQTDDRTEIMQAIAKLPAGFKEVIYLHYYQGYGIAEMAQILALPEGTISSRLSRGRKKLEEIMKGGGEE
ncbi:MAG: RNA polymerase sigma factor [Eubacteriales bacterium]|nr:RNA polymerase sigma factor [Eubacteriales bacterium]MDD3881109.1 RNA polymerase sigma factor [Eubacteriales bacterium]MDD4511491.1 RNA polymerase sigma factor [Eubacteriales bacterium]